MRRSGQDFLWYSALLIGTYLVVSRAGAVAGLITTVGGVASEYARVLQGPRPGDPDYRRG